MKKIRRILSLILVLTTMMTGMTFFADASYTENGIRKVENDYKFIEMKSFGANQFGTCTAIAVCQFLNYMAAQHNMAVVQYDDENGRYLESEYLSKDTVVYANDDLAVESANCARYFPDAETMHQSMVKSGMPKATIGASVAIGLQNFLYYKINKEIMADDRYHYGLKFDVCTYSSDALRRIKNCIDNDIPVIISTKWMPWVKNGFGKYDGHTMLVYGYKTMSDGSTKLIVHDGWYLSNTKSTHNSVTFEYVDGKYISYVYIPSFYNPMKWYTDAPSYKNWAYPGILYVVRNGIMDGTSETRFSPKGTVTRAQAVTALYRMAGEPTTRYMSNNFYDVPISSWYTSAVKWADYHGITTGKSEGRFAPSDVVTREQMVTFLYRYAKSQGFSVALGNSGVRATNYPDFNQVSKYAKTQFDWAVSRGIITGVNKGVQEVSNTAAFAPKNTLVLAPQDVITRDQLARMILRFEMEYDR